MALLKTNNLILHRPTGSYLHPNPGGHTPYKLITNKEQASRFSEEAAKNIVADLNSLNANEFDIIKLEEHEPEVSR